MKNYRFLILTVVLLFASYGHSNAQIPDDKERIDILEQQINHKLRDKTAGHYYETTAIAKNKYSYLWPLCAYIQAANEFETLEPGKGYMSPVVKAIIDQYYTARPL